MATYPGSIVAFATHNTGDTVQAADVNTPNAEIVAVETGLLNGFAHDIFPLNDNGNNCGQAAHRWSNVYGINFQLMGLTSGNVLLKVPAVAGSNTLTLPAGTTDFSATGGTSQYLKQSGAGAAFTVGTIPEADLPNLVGWTDYSGTSTIGGFASFTTKFLSYRRLGSIVYVLFNLQGTSNATTVSFTLPFTANGAWAAANIPITAQDAGGVVPSPVLQLGASSSTVNCYKDNNGTAWTNSGSKLVSGQFWFTL